MVGVGGTWMAQNIHRKELILMFEKKCTFDIFYGLKNEKT